MAQNTISISLRGDKRYRLALSILAAQKDKIIGDLVREALEEKYGGDIAEVMAKNFPHGETSKSQLKRKSRKAEGV